MFMMLWLVFAVAFFYVSSGIRFAGTNPKTIATRDDDDTASRVAATGAADGSGRKWFDSWCYELCCWTGR